MQLAPWLEKTHENFVRDKVQVVPNPLDGSQRMFGSRAPVADGLPGFYTKEIHVSREMVPFEVLTQLDVVGVSLQQMAHPTDLSWTDKLHKIEILGNEEVMASAPGEGLGATPARIETKTIDIAIPFNHFLRWHDLKIKLTFVKHPALPGGLPIRPDRWLITLHGGDCGDPTDETRFDWAKVGPYAHSTD
uniref:Uncharacterized protein n=1 Tax=Marseillevirus LCMAC103 TaxID=2506604 RepID=A0A481YV57_9VIRU|nr:MAG: hypothetical protein LCMAC103_04220 [Marseillevirus LCMAC103]